MPRSFQHVLQNHLAHLRVLALPVVFDDTHKTLADVPQDSNVCVLGQDTQDLNVSLGVRLELWVLGVVEDVIQGEVVQALDCVLPRVHRGVWRGVLEDAWQEPFRAPRHEGQGLLRWRLPELFQDGDAILADLVERIEAALHDLRAGIPQALRELVQGLAARRNAHLVHDGRDDRARGVPDHLARVTDCSQGVGLDVVCDLLWDGSCSSEVGLEQEASALPDDLGLALHLGEDRDQVHVEVRHGTELVQRLHDLLLHVVVWRGCQREELT
mmetsp:Transcript_56934/g.144412  ORF Transcript_56934/g.144412 Transcript_56934/m.144412 type:complete len:270 (+) Transcript_56934:2007-2816(+)